jgi:hypothetical protein
MNSEKIRQELDLAEKGILACVEDIDSILSRMVDSNMVYVGKSFSLRDVREILMRVRFRLVGNTD